MTFKTVALLLAAALFGAAACQQTANSSVKPETITEIGERAHTGLLNSSFDINLKRDGTAQFKCAFYHLSEKDIDESSPQITSIKRCGELYKSNREAFKKISDDGSTSREAVFNGRISPEQFDRLVRLIVENDYFSLANEYLEPGLMDAPPTFTTVKHANGEKTVSSQLDKGGAKLDEIERAIYKMTSEIAWQ